MFENDVQFPHTDFIVSYNEDNVSFFVIKEKDDDKFVVGLKCEKLAASFMAANKYPTLADAKAQRDEIVERNKMDNIVIKKMDKKTRPLPKNLKYSIVKVTVSNEIIA